MINNFKILTVTHRQTDLKAIKNFVVPADEGENVKVRLGRLKQDFELSELFYLATCNRVMYFFESERDVDNAFIRNFFQAVNEDIDPTYLDNFSQYIIHLEGSAAIKHLYEVAASIDSLVVGEREILRQLREAYDRCKDWGLTGDHIRLAAQSAIVAAKEVYAKTRIGEKSVSVVSLAIQKLLRTGLDKEARILLIGAGQTNLLVAKFLRKHHFNNVVVFNRTIHKAQQIADMLGGTAHSLTALEEYQESFDAIIICTGATSAILDTSLYQKLLNGDDRKKVIIDLAIPNNVDEAVVSNFPVQYIEIDGLRNLAKDNLSFREQEVEKASLYINKYVEEFPQAFRQRQLEKAMRSIPQEIRAVKEKAINEVFQKEVALLDPNSRALMEKMMNYMEKKCIGIPMKAARELQL